MFTMTHRYRELIEKKSSMNELKKDEKELTEYVNEAIKKGGKKIADVFGTDKPYFYYAVAISASSLKNIDFSDRELKTITDITPTLVNLVVGIMDDVGLNEKAQYTIVLGKEKDK